LGAVQWAPRVALPEVPFSDDRPLVYVTLGSSGELAALPAVLKGLDGLPLVALLSTAGRTRVADLPSNVSAAPLLPGDVLCRQARFVITNGGSSTGYQALAAGAPVLGIPSNLDQYLATAAIVKGGAGLQLRSGGLRAEHVRAAAVRLLDARTETQNAARWARAFAEVNCHERFALALSTLLGS